VIAAAPDQTNFANVRLGFGVGDLNQSRPSLQAAGATVIAGPARFSDVHLLQLQLAPGIEIELMQAPPASDP
jgi:hypothetical protein